MPDFDAVDRPYVPDYTVTGATNVGRAERLVSTLGGALLAGYGLSKRSLGGAALAALGGALVYRGSTGHCPAYNALGVNTAETDTSVAATPRPLPIEIEEALTVAAPREEVYAFWRTLENLPRFMQHLRSVVDLGGGRSRWEAASPGPVPDIVWEAQITQEQPGTRLAWRSQPGATVDNAGDVRFTDAPGQEVGTEIRVRIGYRPPAGAVGAAVVKWLNPLLGQMVKEDVRRFKSIVEAGEVPVADATVKG